MDIKFKGAYEVQQKTHLLLALRSQNTNLNLTEIVLLELKINVN
jgi:hypothetical protein